MSMEDILKVLVSSRQQGSASQSADPMTELIGGLLGGAQTSQSQSQPAGGLGDMMGLLETVMGGTQGSAASPSSMMNNPIMMLLQPYVEKLAKKANIPPEIAMVVVSFVAHKLLAHHPTSGRDSSSFDLDSLLGQMGSGKIDKNVYQTSGMVKEISKSTGLDETTAAKTLDAAFGLFGKQIKTVTAPATAKPKVPAASQGLKSSGAKSGAKAKGS
ncbi:MAG: hypothetical protein HYZ21_02955 [Chloroflexi bacterium]|nr:hypothetical protein [Chloroflexota bacterium]